MINRDSVYKIGIIGKPHGIHGEVQFRCTDDIFDRYESDYIILDRDGILVPFFIESYRFRSEEVVLIKFCDINSDQAARELTGAEVFFSREAADLDEEHLTWAQVVGFDLFDLSTQKNIGKITHVDEATINLLFEVVTNEGNEHLIPIGEDLIETIDKANRIIRMNIPEGLLSLEE